MKKLPRACRKRDQIVWRLVLAAQAHVELAEAYDKNEMSVPANNARKVALALRERAQAFCRPSTHRKGAENSHE